MNMAKLCVDVVFCKFYNMKWFLVRIYVVALMADNINGHLEAVDVVKAALERGKIMTPTGKFNRVQHQSLAIYDSCCIFCRKKYKISHSPCILADFRYNI